MITKFYYIHGLGSSKNSKKFLELKKQYPNIECLDWTENDNIEKKLNNWHNDLILPLINDYDNICIIASSTGANFAYQLRKKFPQTFFHLVLINPLFDINYLYDKNIIPKNICKYLINMNKLSETLILIGQLDNVINFSDFLNCFEFVKLNNHIIIDEISTHKFENLKQYYSDIDKLINSMYL